MSTVEISTTMREDAMRRPLIVLGALWLILSVVIAASQLLYPPPIEVEWRTETEVNSAGFNVYRALSAEGPYVRLNEQLIPGKGNATTGASYMFLDNRTRPGATYYYRLEDVELDNSAVQHDPIVYTAPYFQWWLPIVVVASALAGLLLLLRGVRTVDKPMERSS